MPAVEMHVNGKRVFVAEVDSDAAVQMILGNLMVNCAPIPDANHFAIAGLSSSSSSSTSEFDPSAMDRASSPHVALSVGDSVTFKIVESGQSNLLPEKSSQLVEVDGIIECRVGPDRRRPVRPNELPAV